MVAPSGDARRARITAAGIVIGRDASADIRVDHNKVSRRHARIWWNEGVWIEDLGSSNGVKLNGRVIRAAAKFSPGDGCEVGAYRLELVATTEDSIVTAAKDAEDTAVRSARAGDLALAPEGAEGTHSVPLGEWLEVGRDRAATVVLADESVSRRHARIEARGDALHIEDLRSSHGTFINGRRIASGRAEVGDEIRFGQARVRIVRSAPSSVAAAPARRPGRGGRRLIPLAFAAVAVVGAVVLALRLGETDGGPADGTGDAHRADAAGRLAEGQDLVPAASARAEGTATATPSRAQKAPATAGLRPPWGPVGRDGLPLSLPEIRPDFDFFDRVKEQLTGARLALDRHDFDVADARLKALRAIDPVNAEADRLRARSVTGRDAEARWTKIERLRRRGALADAYWALSEFPEDTHRSEAAAAAARDIADRALAEAVDQAARAAADRAQWRSAHAQLLRVLRASPGHLAALVAIRTLEDKMRKARRPFVPYQGAPKGGAAPSGPAVRSALQRHHDARSWAVEAALGYLAGDVERAAAALQKAPRAERIRWGQALRKAESLYAQAKEEAARAPSEAWATLVALESLEALFRPEGLHSYFARTVQVQLARAFALEADALMEASRFEDAFQRWHSAERLDPEAPEVQAGLRRLEAEVRNRLGQAEVYRRRGSRRACPLWRSVMSMTVRGSELFETAEKRFAAGCAPTAPAAP